MNQQTNMKKLKDLYFKIKQLSPPPFSGNQLLSDVVETIIELDPYYAGLALTVSESGKVLSPELYKLDNLLSMLNKVELENEMDREIYNQCKVYLDCFSQINSLLKNFT